MLVTQLSSSYVLTHFSWFVYEIWGALIYLLLSRLKKVAAFCFGEPCCCCCSVTLLMPWRRLTNMHLEPSTLQQRWPLAMDLRWHRCRSAHPKTPELKSDIATCKSSFPSHSPIFCRKTSCCQLRHCVWIALRTQATNDPCKHNLHFVLLEGTPQKGKLVFFPWREWESSASDSVTKCCSIGLTLTRGTCSLKRTN